MAQRNSGDDWELNVETCRVELWRGYLTSSFVARLEGDVAGTVVDSSSSFRWRSAKPPDTQEAKLAHYELVSRLKGAGWSPSGEVGEWYETELARPTLVPPKAEPEPEPEPAAPAPVAVVARADPPTPEPTPLAIAAPRDRWRAVAAAGLLAAVAFLVVLALH